jgi:hypothetical protein
MDLISDANIRVRSERAAYREQANIPIAVAERSA